MRKVRKQIIQDLFNALHECNCASIGRGRWFDMNDGELANDLDGSCAAQDNVFGHLAEAIKILEPELYWQYCETGDRSVYTGKGECDNEN